MQRHEMIAAMGSLGLKGMAGAFDEAVTTGLQRKRTTMEILTDLLRAEATHRHTASIRYRMTAAKLPVAKDIDAFVFDGTPSDDVIFNILARRREPPRPLTIVTSEDLALVHPPVADCERYDQLRGLHAAA